jgi:hypothetical protein
MMLKGGDFRGTTLIEPIGPHSIAATKPQLLMRAHPDYEGRHRPALSRWGFGGNSGVASVDAC